MTTDIIETVQKLLPIVEDYNVPDIMYGMLNEYQNLVIKHGVEDEDIPKTVEFLQLFNLIFETVHGEPDNEN